MRTTIKKRIFTVNLLTVSILLVVTAVAFNLVARSYLIDDTIKQLRRIAARAEQVIFVSPHPFRRTVNSETDQAQSYINLLLAMRLPSSSINAEYAFVDNENRVVTPFKRFDKKPSDSDLKVIDKIISYSRDKNATEFTLYESGYQYAAVIKPITLQDGTRAGNLLIYSSLDKINEMQRTINLILFGILLVSAFLVLFLSNSLAKRISEPLSALNSHIKKMSELKFNTFQVPADNEIQELVQNINIMAEKLDTYNKSQKIFLQNASHEFRTPIMSIQSHAEGILYGVIEGPEAARIIIDESKRLTHMVEELLYLSRLDAIEEVYHIENVDIKGLIQDICQRLMSISGMNHVALNMDFCESPAFISGDPDKLERCITNVISNCIRYAKSRVEIKLTKQTDKVIITISDDGPGFDKDEEKQIFKRFYKGKKGNIGLGLAISKSIVEKHRGTIEARNTDEGVQFIIELPAIREQ